MHYRLDESAGSLTAADEITSDDQGAQDLTSVGGVSAFVGNPGILGGAATFNNDQNQALVWNAAPFIGESLSSTGFWTMSAWIKYTSSDFDTMVSTGQNFNFDQYAFLGTGLGNPLAEYISGQSDRPRARKPTDSNDGLWHHAVWTIEPTTDPAVPQGQTDVRKLYVDGMLVAEADLVQQVVPTERIGLGGLVRGDALPNQVANAYEGELDDVGFWDSILTPAEVALLNGLGRFAGTTLSDPEIAAALDVFNAGTGSTSIGGKDWSFVTGLVGVTGEIGGDVAADTAFIVLDGDAGTGISLASGTTTITGDYDTSGQVEQGDLDIVLQNWGTGTFTGDEAALVGGGPFDGTVDQNELDGVLQNWGSTSAPDFTGNAVPEPAGLIALGALLAVAGRRRY